MVGRSSTRHHDVKTVQLCCRDAGGQQLTAKAARVVDDVAPNNRIFRGAVDVTHFYRKALAQLALGNLIPCQRLL